MCHSVYKLFPLVVLRLVNVIVQQGLANNKENLRLQNPQWRIVTTMSIQDCKALKVNLALKELQNDIDLENEFDVL